MPLAEQLLQIFIDQLVASMIVPMKSAYILNVIENLNPELFIPGTIVALLGSIIGGIISYILGYIIANSFFNIKQSPNKKYQNLYYFMLLTPLNYFGGVITFLAGFGHMNKKKFILLLTAVNCAYFLIRSLLFIA